MAGESGQGQPEAARQREVRIMRAWQGLCFLAFSQGDSARAVLAARKCASLARELGDDRVLAMVLTFEASANLVGGGGEGLDSLLEEAVTASRRSGDKYALGMALGMLSSRLMASPRHAEQAQAYAEESLALLKESGNRFAFLMGRFGMAMGARYAGRFDEARSQLLPLYPTFLEIGDQHRANMIRSEIAHIDRVQGQYPQAESAYRETILEWQRLGHRAAVAHQLECFALLAATRGQPQQAARLFGAAEALRERIDIPMTKFERIEYERQVAGLRAQMEEKAFDLAWAEGRGLSMEGAIQAALEPAPGDA
jgi:hypothetical protein